MDQNTVAQENVVFFITAVGVSLRRIDFFQAVLNSTKGVTQFPTDGIGEPGYIRIDISSIRQKSEEIWDKFVGMVVIDGILNDISHRFGNDMNFEGEFLEKVAVKEGGFKFAFEIRQYERDMEHEFKIIDPEDLKDIPDDEKLGRVSYLTIVPL